MKRLTDGYYFMQIAKKEYNANLRIAFPTTELAYDRQDKTLFEPTVYNGDFSNK